MPSYTYSCVLLCFDLLTPVACHVVKLLFRRRRLLCFVSPFAFRLFIIAPFLFSDMQILVSLCLPVVEFGLMRKYL
jgi:hypothetical protein